ncbi:LysM-like peptidoglycan-binding domain-containing protein [Actinobacillus succinogenes]|uniref:LysM-like peptidoglycan-binding domain-containing protein n=1 Tax=Actinobacillus succinogenes TaxID=67854 RepID=UPI00030C7705|nr:LysM-like peptidoglycan-binding domain-containing protein [Actinobacillus succinogenes]
MENTPKNDSANQNELDLGLNSNEPVTPRKATTNEPSFLNKLFKKKETATNPFAERREPTFGTEKVNATLNPGEVVKSVAASMNNNPSNNANGVNPQQPTATASNIAQGYSAPTYSSSPNSQPKEATSARGNDSVQTENVNYADESGTNKKTVTSKTSFKNPEDWKVMQKLPHKHRRLFLAIAAAVVILAALLLLKPRSETVEDFQANSNGNTMPIEFQSLDPNKPLENTETANADTVAPSPDVNAQADNSRPNEQATQAASNAVTNAVSVATGAYNTVNQSAESATAANLPAANTVSAANSVINNADHQAQLKAAEQTRLEKAREAQRKAEQQAQAVKLKAEQQAKEKARLTQQQAQTKAQPAKTPVVDAKPAGNKAVARQSKAVNGSSKTLTIPSGTSLFQVFRTNGLDIRDANAMTKASGANNVLSSFKANDKVQVATNGEGRVVTMRLSDGSVFTRQSDGTYKYSK